MSSPRPDDERLPVPGGTFPAAVRIAALLAVAPLTALSQVAPEDSSISDLKLLSLDELLNTEVTSVSKRPERLSEVASALQVITNNEIRRSGSTILPEAMRIAGNLHVAQKGSHAWGISARGFNTDSANKMLVLIDGRAVYTPLFSGVFWDRQDYLLEDIDRIEVISGPGSTLWGANAVNGVINIVTKDSAQTVGSFVEAAHGPELNGYFAARQGVEVKPGVTLRAYGKYSDHDGGFLADGSEAGDSWRSRQAGFRMDARTSTSDTVTFEGDAFQTDEELTTGGESRARSVNLLARWSRTMSRDSGMSLQFYLDRTKLDLPVPASALAPAGLFRDDLDTFDLDFQQRLAPGRVHTIVWGSGYRWTRDEVENAPGLAFLPENLSQGLFNAFIQDEIALPGSAALTVGSKVEHNDYTGWEIEPNARIRWNLRSDHVVWAAVSHAVRAPSRIERDFSQPAPGYLVVLLSGNDRFKSETVTAYEVGYRGQVREDASISLSGFLNDYDDLRSTSMSPPDPVFGLPFPFYFENNLKARTYGAEIDAIWQPIQWWRLRASGSLLKEEIRIKPGKSDFNNGLNETADPEHQFSLRSSMDLPGNFELDAALRRVGSFDINNVGVPETVPGYTELDVRIAWRTGAGLELSVTGQNLLHDQHQEYAITNEPVIGIGRSIFGKITWRY